MRLKIAMRTVLSVALASLLTACGGGGGNGSDDKYPAHNTIQLVAGTQAAPAGNYRVDTQSSGAGVFQTSGGSIVESATAVTSDFALEVNFQQSNPNKYVLIFVDRDDEFYACRSQGLSDIEMAIWFNATEFELPVCGPGLTIDARNHRAKASNVVIPGLNELEAQVTVSANVAWTLQ